jgi:hypothetical protein
VSGRCQHDVSEWTTAFQAEPPNVGVLSGNNPEVMDISGGHVWRRIQRILGSVPSRVGAPATGCLIAREGAFVPRSAPQANLGGEGRSVLVLTALCDQARIGEFAHGDEGAMYERPVGGTPPSGVAIGSVSVALVAPRIPRC